MGSPQLSRRWTVARIFGTGSLKDLSYLGLPFRRWGRGGDEEGIDDRIPRHQDLTRRRILLQQGSTGCPSGRVVDLGQAVGQTAIDLLRVGAVDTIGPQAGFHVGHRDHAVVGGEGGGEGGSGIAVHHHEIGVLRLQDGVEAVKDR